MDALEIGGEEVATFMDDDNGGQHRSGLQNRLGALEAAEIESGDGPSLELEPFLMWVSAPFVEKLPLVMEIGKRMGQSF